MRRRELITLLAGAAAVLCLSSILFSAFWPHGARAQATVRPLRVGFVGAQPRDAPIYVAFRKRMAELGYQEDRNFTFEYIQTPSIDAYDTSFRELAARKLDIIMAAGNEPALRAARAAAGTLPIVFLAIDFDPVERGYVASMARPGGNITGIFVHPLELAAKRIELVREALPQARRLGLIWDASSRDQAEAAATAAQTLGFEPRRIEVTGQPPDYVAALAQMADAPGEPMVIPAGPIFLRDRITIGRLMIERRIPSIGAFREIVEAGALMSYGIDLVALFRDVAGVVDQVAKGAKPAELPIVQSSRFHLAVNLKTAATLGITLPLALTSRADEVIE
jgi:putative ABC transport system substrate-binding protein